MTASTSNKATLDLSGQSAETTTYDFNLGERALTSGERPDMHGASLDLDAAMSLMGSEISDWLDGTINDIQESLLGHIAAGGKPPRTLMHMLQELRGQAGSMGFPLASRASSALYKLLEAGHAGPADILVAHIEALRAIVSDRAKGLENDLAVALVEALEQYGSLWSSRNAGNHSESNLQA